MKKAPKIILIAVGVLVVLLVVAVGIALASLDAIVKAGVEQGGSRALKVQVKLDSARISILGGSADLQGFSVANPPPFKTPCAVNFGAIHARVALGSLRKDVVVVPEVTIRQPEISIEGDLQEGSNLQRLIKNLDETIAGAGPPGEKPPGKLAPAEPKAGKKFRIDRLVIEKAKVSLGATFLGGKATSVALERIELKDLGNDGNGISMAQVIRKVLSAILVEASSQATGSASSALKELTSRSGLTGTVGEGIKQTGKGLIEGVKGIFKK